MGYWRTVRGRKVYFEDGDDIETALKRSKEYSKKKKKADEDDTSTARDAAAYYLKKGEFHKFDQYIKEGGLEDEREEFLATAGYGIKKDYEEYKARKNFEKAVTTEVKTEQDLQNQINAWNKYKAAGGNEEKLAKSVEERHKQELNKELEKSPAYKDYNNELEKIDAQRTATWKEYNDKIREVYKDKNLNDDQKFQKAKKLENEKSRKAEELTNQYKAKLSQKEEAQQSPLQKSISSLNRIDDLANEATNYTGAYSLEKLQKMGREMGSKDFEKFVGDLKANKEAKQREFANATKKVEQSRDRATARKIKKESAALKNIDKEIAENTDPKRAEFLKATKARYQNDVNGDLKTSNNKSLSEINSEFNRAESNWANAQTTAERVKWSREASRLSALREEAYDREEARIKSNTAKKTNGWRYNRGIDGYTKKHGDGTSSEIWYDSKRGKETFTREDYDAQGKKTGSQVFRTLYEAKEGNEIPRTKLKGITSSIEAEKQVKLAYKKYLREHPNSKLKYQDFKRFAK